MKSIKFTDAQRRAILLDYIAGVRLDEIAKRHGCANNYPTKLARGAGFPTRTVDRGYSRERTDRAWRRAYGEGG